MNIKFSFGLWFLCLNLGAFAQEEYSKNLSKQDIEMPGDSNKSLRRWANTTFGLSLEKNEEILFDDETVIIIGESGHPRRIMATYEFNPALLSTGLQLELVNVRNLIISDFGATKRSVRRVPSWLSSMCNLVGLAIWNGDLKDVELCENLPLEYLDLRGVAYNGKEVLSRIIDGVKGIKLFIHDDSILADDVLLVKEKLPGATIISKGATLKP